MTQRMISTTRIFPKATLFVATSCIGSGLREAWRTKLPDAVGLDAAHRALDWHGATLMPGDSGCTLTAGRSRPDAEDVGNRPCRGIRIILSECSLITAIHFQLKSSYMQVELRFRTALEMLGGNQTNARRQEFVAEIVHSKWRAGINK